jgi:hypothetical protein
LSHLSGTCITVLLCDVTHLVASIWHISLVVSLIYVCSRVSLIHTISVVVRPFQALLSGK